MVLLLIGGGHAHLNILRDIRENKVEYQVTLISASKFQYYSGMFSGYTEGLYSEDDIRIDLEELCEQAGVSFVEDTIVQVDALFRKLIGTSGKTYDFKVVSFDIGSTIKELEGIVIQTKIKPNFSFPMEINEFRKTTFPVVVGGGAAGVEMALSVQAWRYKNDFPPNVKIISSSPILMSISKKANLKIGRIVEQKGIQLYENDRIKEVYTDELVTNSGKRMSSSNVFSLTGPESSRLFEDGSLPTDSKGFLLVKDSLQVETYPWVFGAGDCVTMDSYPTLPKNGVYAVKQGPILWHNINQYLAGKRLKNFKPQRNFISILSVGQRQGLIIYGKHAYYGKWPWWLKHWIDVKFMKKHMKK
ncbi:FAD-dependent oxidoreductase [Paenisporosarcina sp. TG20]|uniref:FAD-dependent oxidoreductase n=1 Tax=Paenisporosarcina sp. TG20 TaxID=1211706 RepID=UPI00030B34D3|nr:FAD-dependent oxidoreductase [Paenisporosarcina sp. TG20]